MPTLPSLQPSMPAPLGTPGLVRSQSSQLWHEGQGLRRQSSRLFSGADSGGTPPATPGQPRASAGVGGVAADDEDAKVLDWLLAGRSPGFTYHLHQSKEKAQEEATGTRRHSTPQTRPRSQSWDGERTPGPPPASPALQRHAVSYHGAGQRMDALWRTDDGNAFAEALGAQRSDHLPAARSRERDRRRHKALQKSVSAAATSAAWTASGGSAGDHGSIAGSVRSGRVGNLRPGSDTGSADGTASVVASVSNSSVFATDPHERGTAATESAFARQRFDMVRRSPLLTTPSRGQPEHAVRKRRHWVCCCDARHPFMLCCTVPY